MSEFINKLKDNGILIVFFAVTIIGAIFSYFFGEDVIVNKIYSALDTGSAVALAILACYAYYQYVKDKKNSKKLLKQIENTSKITNKDALIGIQFGGTNNAIEDMRNFSKTKNINEQMIFIKHFGDKDNKVSKDDIAELEKYLKETMPKLSNAGKVHLLVAGMGIAYYVCADIFANWKPIIVYHNNAGTYEPWTMDNKHREKVDEKLKDIS